MSKDLRIIIVGGGHVGYHTAELLDNRGHDVVIVEKDEDRVEFLNDQYVATVIHGDGGRPSILREAQPGRSDVVAALTSYGAMTNLGICMAAQRLAPDVHTVARIDHGDHEEYEEMVDAVVYPEELAAHSAANEVIAVSDGGARTVEQFEHMELMEIEVTPEAPGANKRFSDIGFPKGSLVIQRTDEPEFASGDTVLEPGASYLVAVRPDCSDDLLRLLRG